MVCKVGDWFQVPPGVPHSVKTGPDGSTVIGTYVIPDGEELTTFSALPGVLSTLSNTSPLRSRSQPAGCLRVAYRRYTCSNDGIGAASSRSVAKLETTAVAPAARSASGAW